MQALRVEAKSRPASQDMKEGFGHTVTCGKAVCQLFGGALLEVHVHQRRAEARVSRRMWVGGLGIQKVGWGYNRWVGDTIGGLGIQEKNKDMRGSVWYGVGNHQGSRRTEAGNEETGSIMHDCVFTSICSLASHNLEPATIRDSTQWSRLCCCSSALSLNIWTPCSVPCFVPPAQPAKHKLPKSALSIPCSLFCIHVQGHAALDESDQPAAAGQGCYHACDIPNSTDH